MNFEEIIILLMTTGVMNMMRIVTKVLLYFLNCFVQ